MIDLLLQPLHLRVGDGHTGAAGALRRQAEVGFDVEQIVLNACQHGIEGVVGAGVEPRQAEHRVDLVQRAVRRDTQIVFLAPLAAAERGRAVIAGAGVNPVENDHRPRSYSRQILFAPSPIRAKSYSRQVPFRTRPCLRSICPSPRPSAL